MTLCPVAVRWHRALVVVGVERSRELRGAGWAPPQVEDGQRERGAEV